MFENYRFILASNSPRRRRLLAQLGLHYEVCDPGIDEVVDQLKSPAENVTLLALHKAQAAAHSVPEGIIISADTLVVLDGEILGKPVSPEDAIEMLSKLSGRTHTVFTGFALLDRPSNRSHFDFAATEVTFRKLEQKEILEYVRSGSPLDKAGAYGIQDDRGAIFVERIDGCFYNVVGLPLTKLYLSLKSFLEDKS